MIIFCGCHAKLLPFLLIAATTIAVWVLASGGTSGVTSALGYRVHSVHTGGLTLCCLCLCCLGCCCLLLPVLG